MERYTEQRNWYECAERMELWLILMAVEGQQTRRQLEIERQLIGVRCRCSPSAFTSFEVVLSRAEQLVDGPLMAHFTFSVSDRLFPFLGKTEYTF